MCFFEIAALVGQQQSHIPSRIYAAVAVSSALEDDDAPVVFYISLVRLVFVVFIQCAWFPKSIFFSTKTIWELTKWGAENQDLGTFWEGVFSRITREKIRFKNIFFLYDCFCWEFWRTRQDSNLWPLPSKNRVLSRRHYITVIYGTQKYLRRVWETHFHAYFATNNPLYPQ